MFLLAQDSFPFSPSYLKRLPFPLSQFLIFFLLFSVCTTGAWATVSLRILLHWVLVKRLTGQLRRGLYSWVLTARAWAGKQQLMRLQRRAFFWPLLSEFHSLSKVRFCCCFRIFYCTDIHIFPFQCCAQKAVSFRKRHIRNQKCVWDLW